METEQNQYSTCNGHVMWLHIYQVADIQLQLVCDAVQQFSLSFYFTTMAVMVFTHIPFNVRHKATKCVLLWQSDMT